MTIVRAARRSGIAGGHGRLASAQPHPELAAGRSCASVNTRGGPRRFAPIEHADVPATKQLSDRGRRGRRRSSGRRPASRASRAARMTKVRSPAPWAPEWSPKKCPEVRRRRGVALVGEPGLEGVAAEVLPPPSPPGPLARDARTSGAAGRAAPACRSGSAGSTRSRRTSRPGRSPPAPPRGPVGEPEPLGVLVREEYGALVHLHARHNRPPG